VRQKAKVRKMERERERELSYSNNWILVNCIHSGNFNYTRYYILQYSFVFFRDVHSGAELRRNGKTDARYHLVLDGKLRCVFRKCKRFHELAKDNSQSSHGNVLADARALARCERLVIFTWLFQFDRRPLCRRCLGRRSDGIVPTRRLKRVRVFPSVWIAV